MLLGLTLIKITNETLSLSEVGEIFMSEPKFKVGDRIKHFAYGKGTILGNYHKRPDGNYYWHIEYDNHTFGYNREISMKSI
jgi:hypothetical protein